jgi:hypothetical protein
MPAVKDTTCIERIYTPETVFNNMASNILVPLFGGGARLGGKFPGAIALGIRANQRINAIAQLTDRLRFSTGEKPGEGSYLDGLGRLHIALPANKKLVQFEAALGDLDITSMKYNKDGYFGRSGKAEASIFIRNKDVASRSFCLIARNNIGMAGLIATGAPNNDFTTIEGDEIIIQVDFDVAFLMGFRIRMKN